MTSGWRMSADDERAVSTALGVMAHKQLIQGAVTREDLRQEMALALWKKPQDEIAAKVQQCKSAGIDYVRKILGRPGGARSRHAHAEVRPDDGDAHDRMLDSQSGGDDPELWAEVAQEIERAMERQKPPAPPAAPQKRQRARPVGAPDPKSLTRISGGPPPPINPPVSAWTKVYATLEPGGDGVLLSEEQARSFASWGRAHKCRVIRRRLPTGEHGVWRVTEE
jgi:hypothetical protein